MTQKKNLKKLLAVGSIISLFMFVVFFASAKTVHADETEPAADVQTETINMSESTTEDVSADSDTTPAEAGSEKEELEAGVEEEATEPVLTTKNTKNKIAASDQTQQEVEESTDSATEEKETETESSGDQVNNEEMPPEDVPEAEETYSWRGTVGSSFTGLAQEKSGTWYYLRNGKPDFSYSNLVYYQGSWFYVRDGIIDWTYNTLSQVNGSGVWYRVRNGKIDWNFTGLFQYYSTWYYIQNGRLNWGYNGLIYYNNTWFYVKNGRIDWTYSNLIQYYGKWYYVHNGKIDWGYSTLSQVNGGGTWYYVKNGQLDWSFTGLSQYYTTWYYIQKGLLNWGYTGLAYHGGNWFYVNSGRVDWSFTGLAGYGADYYYVKDGKVDWSYSGKAKLSGYNKEFDVINGKLSGGTVAPSAAVANKADTVLNRIGWDLRAAYDWSVMNWTVYDVDGGYGVAHYADYGLNNHHGNCYVMAGTFVAMARQLGYEAYQISGSVPSIYGGLTPHSWAEVKVGNSYFVFDPDFEEEAGGNGYQFNYGTRGTWRYSDYYRMHN